MLNVKLLAHTPEPEKLVASAAKLCYSSSSIEDLQQKQTEKSVQIFVKMLSEVGHESPLEHISFTFGIEGVSRALMAQLTRHRIVSYSVQSQRYVKNKEFTYVVPPEIENIPEAKREFLTAMEQAQAHYDKITDVLVQKHKEGLIKLGTDEETAGKAAEKRAIEDARYILPNACETKIICTFNARSLMHLFELRCCNRAQWEIRELATQMLKLVLKVAPNVFSHSGPSCFNGPCKEGKMCCGKFKEMREFFKNLNSFE